MGDSRTIAFCTKWSDGGEQRASSAGIPHAGEALDDITSLFQIASAWSENFLPICFWRGVYDK